MITRFAPSPTGRMHVGNARTALLCWLYARSKSGKFILRIDDTDSIRSESKYVEALKEDLEWLQIDWDICFNQLSRVDRYDSIFNSLLKEEIVYPCYETREELEIKRSMMLKMGIPPIYDRSALRMTKKDVQEHSGRRPYFRLKIDQSREIAWEDEILGKIVFKAQNISDPIIKRGDGTYTYMFPSVIDDIDYKVTHIMRGEDHVSNTATQICMMDVLKAPMPVFVHLPLVHVGDSKISKRAGCEYMEINKLRDMGIEPMTINSYFARLGTSLPIEPHSDIKEFTSSFDIKTFNRAPVKFSIDDVLRLNNKVLQKLTFSSVKDKLMLWGIECSEEFWNLVRGNIDKLEDVRAWKEICSSKITTVVSEKDREFLVKAAELLPDCELDARTCDSWLSQIKKETGRGTRDILLPLRLALTGLSRGPGLAELCSFMGRSEVARRLMCQS
ncbi:MAG: glutamate--tRNA ligase [Aaplasma endosymbiont of Hyalomma asiaticum]